MICLSQSQEYCSPLPVAGVGVIRGPTLANEMGEKAVGARARASGKDFLPHRREQFKDKFPLHPLFLLPACGCVVRG